MHFNISFRKCNSILLFSLLKLFHFNCFDRAMLYAHTAGMAKLRVGEFGNSVFNAQAVCGTFLNTDAAAVAELFINNGLFPLLSGCVFAADSVFVEKGFIFADIGTGAAVNAAVGVNLVLFLHVAGGCSYGANLLTFIAAITFICNFVSHNKPPC